MINETDKKIKSGGNNSSNRSKIYNILRHRIAVFCIPGLNTIKQSILRHKELVRKVAILTLSIIFAFILGLYLGIGNKQAITAIFKAPEGFNMELDGNFFAKMDELFKSKEKTENNQNKDNNLIKDGYVASKIGKKFYPISCKASESLSEKNKIYFNSEDQAKKEGYTLSERCK